MPGTSNVYIGEEPGVHLPRRRTFKEEAEARGYTWRPPLWEHGPEPDERWCLRHYQTDGWGPFLNRSGHCLDCEDEDYQEWLEDVRWHLEFALVRVAEGFTDLPWRPAEDTREAILVRLMDLGDVPRTVEATTAWFTDFETHYQASRARLRSLVDERLAIRKQNDEAHGNGPESPAGGQGEQAG